MSQKGVVQAGFEGLQYSQSSSQGSVAIKDQFSKRSAELLRNAEPGKPRSEMRSGGALPGGNTCRTRRKVTSNC